MIIQYSIFWILVMLVVSMIICHYVLIIPAEDYLLSKFGEEDRNYTATVHRWLR